MDEKGKVCTHSAEVITVAFTFSSACKNGGV